MRKNLILFAALAVILVSCQKEVDFAPGGGSGGGGGSTSGNRLVKAVSKTASDSVITIYAYNSAGKIINVKSTGMDGGQDAGNEYRYYRNASGIITRTVQINPNLVVAGIDSVITRVNYVGSRYTSDVSSLSLFGFTVNDSTVHIYDASGKVIRDEEYQEFVGVSPYELTLKTVYTYDAAGNVKQMDFYSHDAVTGSDDLVATMKYTFDSKSAAVNYGQDAIGIGQVDLVSVNNPIKAEFIDATDPANNFTFNFTFNYNSNNKPTTGTQTQTPGGSTKNLSFFYQ
jgi:hypothetical protein